MGISIKIISYYATHPLITIIIIRSIYHSYILLVSSAKSKLKFIMLLFCAVSVLPYYS